MIICFSSATGGHLYPAIATCQGLDEACMILSEDRLVTRQVLSAYKIAYEFLPFNAHKKKNWIYCFMASFKLLKQTKCHLLISTGGGLSLPVVLAAFLRRVPIILLEQNALPGRANRILGKLANQIFVSFKESCSYFSGKKTIVSGNPIRSYFGSTTIGPYRHLFSKERRIVLIVGGSQGAEALNEFAEEHYQLFMARGYDVIHIVGKSHNVKKISFSNVLYGDQGGVVWTPEYVEAMDQLYKLVDVVLCRAGATTIAELIAFQMPAVLVPYPFAKDQHQKKNAEAISHHEQYDWISQSDLSYPLVIDKLECVQSKICSYKGPIDHRARDMIVQACQSYAALK